MFSSVYPFLIKTKPRIEKQIKTIKSSATHGRKPYPSRELISFILQKMWILLLDNIPLLILEVK